MKYLLVVITCLISSACYKPTLLKNTLEKDSIKVCIVLLDEQINKNHVWNYYAFYPEKKDDVMYYFNTSEFLSLADDSSCVKLKAIYEIDVSSDYRSTGEAKGEAVSVYLYRCELL